MRIRAGFIPLLGVTLTATLIGVVANWAMHQLAVPATPQAAPYVGIRFTALEPLGVRVEEVLPGSPAEKAGIIPGDLIYTMDGTYINGESLMAEVLAHHPNDVVTLGIQRDEQNKQLEVQIATVPENPQHNVEMMSIETASNSFYTTGLVYDMDEHVWLVTDITPTDTLHAVGLRVGDRITTINGHTVTPDTRNHLTTPTLTEDVVQLTVERDGQSHDVEVPSVMVCLILINAMQTAELQ